MAWFAIIFFTLIGAFHAYIGWRLIPNGSRRLWVVVAISAVSIPSTFFLGRVLVPGFAGKLTSWFGFMALGIMGILFGLVLLRDVLLGGARLATRGTDPSRREFLRRASTFGVLGIGTAIVAEGLVNAARPPALERVRVPIANLPKALEGFKIAQISDTHLGPTLGHDFIADVVRRTNELEPDVIAFTGDMIDGYADRMQHDVAPLGDLRAKHGAYFVTGNHEYYWEPLEWIEAAKGLGLDVLMNEHRMLEVGGAKLAIGGVPDVRETRRFDGHVSDPQAAFVGAEDADVKVMLAHQPGSLYGAQEAGVDLQLCGHTHGGQVFPVNLLVYLAYPVVRGLEKFGKTWVYVNRGTAYWGPPMRTGGAGEITLVELARA